MFNYTTFHKVINIKCNLYLTNNLHHKKKNTKIDCMSYTNNPTNHRINHAVQFNTYQSKKANRIATLNLRIPLNNNGVISL